MHDKHDSKPKKPNETKNKPETDAAASKQANQDLAPPPPPPVIFLVPEDGTRPIKP